VLKRFANEAQTSKKSFLNQNFEKEAKTNFLLSN